MGDPATVIVLFVIGAALLGSLLPTVPLSLAAAAVYTLGLLLLVLVHQSEISMVGLKLALVVAVLAALAGHIARRLLVPFESEKDGSE